MFNLLPGDLGRHGSGPVYDSLTTKYSRAACKSQQVHKAEHLLMKLNITCKFPCWILHMIK